MIKEDILLRDQEIFPAKEVLKKSLGDSYSVFEELIEIIAGAEYGLVPGWNYYKDGKAWLCKVCYKKKTIFWLSVWDRFFKTTFYFTEKNCSGIADLDIEENLKESFRSSKSFGKFMPLTINLNRKEQIKEVLKIIEYKMSLK
jgi:hypothetical protein